MMASAPQAVFAMTEAGISDDDSWSNILKRRIATAPVHAALASDTDVVFRDGFDGNHCTANQTRSCYSGAGGTAGVGTCAAGTQYCVDGQFGPCTGQVTPHAESCNGRDDDCDATADNGLGTVTCGVGACQQSVAACSAGAVGTCTPGAPSAEICDGIDNDCDGAIDEDGCGCVHVSPLGLDTNPGTATNPMKTINAGIARAVQSGPSIVCVATGVTCLAAANYNEAVTMHNGIHVYGGYQQVGNPWPRVATCVTSIRAQDALGVSFDAAVVDPTILDGFTISAQAAAPANAAITVKGSTGAVINDNVITGGNGTTSYGINVIDDVGKAATPTITGNTIAGGNGTALAVGVRSLNSAPVVRANCGTVDVLGRCTSSCSAVVGRSIRARTTGGSGTASDAIRLESSPGAVIDQNTICSGSSTAAAAGIRISGDAEATVIRGNMINGIGGQQDSVGVWAEPCAGASPWIAGNNLISAAAGVAGAHMEGIRAIGDCHPRIDSNARIVGSAEGSANLVATGIACEEDTGTHVSSRCTIDGNGQILGSASGSPATSIGIRCDDGACAAVRDNTVISGRAGGNSTGVSLGDTDALVDSNVIEAGCASSIGTGLLSDNSRARIQNNQISGAGGDNCMSTPATSVAVEVLVGNGSNEIDLHSNDVFAGGFSGACTSIGIAFDLSAQPPPGARGIARNNIVLAGLCNQSFDIAELDVAADPRVLENNDLWHNPNLATALYRDEASSNLVTAAAVNALPDIAASANISADPLLSPDGHIAGGSVCRNTGTSAGGPLYDYEGDLRPQESGFDIGRDEYHP
jgi:hypothetical protein